MSKKKITKEEMLHQIGEKIIGEYNRGIVVRYDDLLGAVDFHMGEYGLNPVDDDGDEIVGYIKDTYKLSVCDLCGELIPNDDECVVEGSLMAGLATMAQAGETDYLWDDPRMATLICKDCAEHVANYKPKYEWAGCAFRHKDKLDEDKARTATLNERSVGLEDLPKWARFELKQKLLDEQNAEKGEGTSVEEMLNADYLIGDDELREKFGGTTFCAEDFAGAPTD